MSVRARLLLTSLLTLAVGLGALVVAGNVLLDRRVEHEASRLLRERADTQLAALDLRGGRVAVRETPNDERLDRRAWVLDRGRLVEQPAGAPAALTRVAVALGQAGGVAERDGPGDVRLRAQPIRAGGRTLGAVVVGTDVAATEALQEEVLVASIVGAALILLAGAVVLRSALLGALRPVEQMTERAEAWSASDLEQRFALGPARDELTGLAATLDGLLERIAASRRHEQRFAGDLAHELRTPLAALRGRAELALRVTGADAGEERTRALRGVVEQAERLDATIDALLALARQELDPSRGAADLAALAGEHADPGGEPSICVRTAGALPLPLAAGEPEVVRRALAPLVDNARRHARSAVTLEVSASPGHVAVAVRDDGPGLPPDLGEAAFEPGRRGPGADVAAGAGLGLALARRLARSCGGEVTAVTGEAGGCFLLELPALGRT